VTGPSLALVLLAAAIHASWNALAKGGRDPVVFLWLSNCVASVTLAPVALAFAVTRGMPLGAVPFVIGTAILHSVYFYALGRAYRTGQFSVVYPMARGLGVGVAPLLALVAFDERLSGIGTAGIALVAVGILGLHALPRVAAVATQSDVPLGAATGWAVVTGLTIAMYSVLDKAGAGRVSPPFYLALMEMGTALFVAPAALASRTVALEWREHRQRILFSGIASPLAYLLILFAFQTAKTGYVVAAREFSIVLSAVIGVVVFREGHLGPRLVGAAVILAGVACIAVAR
jgi:drug/metabolite transporter (DMT)-like permease